MTNRSGEEVGIVLAGIGGYGEGYLRRILDSQADRNIRLVGAVDPYPQRCGSLDKLKAQSVRLYDSLAQFYRDSSADLAIICSPIHMHKPQTCLALMQGSHVLCEKPLTATIQDAREMAVAQQEAEKFVAVGYQWSFSQAIQSLKRDIIAGRLGKPLRLRTIVLWPRRHSYYRRNDWAGALKSPDRQWVLDSPANNAAAHFLHNMFYVLGGAARTSAMPAKVQAELYRANDITNYDTAAIRCRTDAGTEVLFYATHAVNVQRGPVFSYEFEHATVVFGDDPEDNLIANFHDGSREVYGNPDADNFAKLDLAVDCVRTGDEPLCTIQAATAQTLAINGAQESAHGVTPLPADLIEVTEIDDDRLTWVHGLTEQLQDCYDGGCLPSEHGRIDWTRPGRIVDMRNYRFFPAAEK